MKIYIKLSKKFIIKLILSLFCIIFLLISGCGGSKKSSAEITPEPLVKPKISEINFSDFKLESRAVASGKTYADEVNELDASNQNLSDLRGLQYFVNLTSLLLSNNHIDDISLLKDMVFLEKLHLNKNKIKERYPLSYFY